MNQSPTPPDDAERWLPADRWEGLYEVSNLGRVRSVPRVVTRPGNRGRTVRVQGRILKQYGPTERIPYHFVELWRDGRGLKVKVYTLVAAAFLGPRPAKHDICHGPAGKLDDSVANLSYGTRSKNLGEDRRRDGTIPAGSRSGTAKLNEEIVSQCRVRAAAGESVKLMAAEFGVSYGVMWRAVDGITWQHVPIVTRTKRQRKPRAALPPAGTWYGVRISAPIQAASPRQIAA